MAEHDGTFRCKPCRQPLNETDANCWRCGSKDIADERPARATTTTGGPVFTINVSTSDFQAVVDAQLDALIENFNAGWKG